MGDGLLVELKRKVYEKNELKGFTISIYSYIAKDYTCIVDTKNILKQNMYAAIQSKQIIPINFTIAGNRLMLIKVKDKRELILCVLKAVRKYVELKYGTGVDLSGRCIEASEIIAEILRRHKIAAKTIEGWCLYDDEYYGSDRPFSEHTWVEIGDTGIYADVTADQFNVGMEEYNYFKDIILMKGLPHGMMYDMPVEGEDYWLQ